MTNENRPKPAPSEQPFDINDSRKDETGDEDRRKLPGRGDPEESPFDINEDSVDS